MNYSTSSIKVQVDADIKRRANEALAEIGLSMSDAVRIFLHRVAADQQFPWELKVPNAETQAAMKEARAKANSRKPDMSAKKPAADLEKAGCK